MSDVPASDDIVYAGFWRRLGAYVIDSLIITVAFYLVVLAAVLIMATTGEWNAESAEAGMWFVFLLLPLYYIGAALYYGLQESSRHQATVGKRALGIKVADSQGRRLTRGNAIGRWFAAALSYLTLYVGFIMAAFTERKRALHDIVAETIVVDRWAFTEHPERQQRHVGGLAILLSLVLVLVPVIAILAAIAIPAYQDYTVRAKIAGAIAVAKPLQEAVVAHHEQDSACPTNDKGTIGPAETYATGNVARIETGQMEGSDNCGIQITLRDLPTTDANGQRIWLELDPETGRWHCSSEVPDRLLPANCRG